MLVVLGVWVVSCVASREGILFGFAKFTKNLRKRETQKKQQQQKKTTIYKCEI